MTSKAGQSRNAAMRSQAQASRNRASRYGAPKFPQQPALRQFTTKVTMTQATPPAAPPAPVPTNATAMTEAQYAAARAEIRRGNVPIYQPAQGAK